VSTRTARARRPPNDLTSESGPLPAGMRYEHGKVVPHLTVDERVARGRAARREVPRSSHAVFEPAAMRHDPVDLLERQATTRVAELVPIRYGRMLVSPFTFYRGAALLMAADLAGTPRSGLITQVCGDAHLSNFGAFASPERQLVFDINDFDETLPGPWEWDVKRLAASVAIAGRENGHSTKQRRQAVAATVSQYRMAMNEFARRRNLDLWYAHIAIDDLMPLLATQLDRRSRKRTKGLVAKARTRDNLNALGKLTELVDGSRRIISAPPLIQPIEELAGSMDPAEIDTFLRSALRSYRQTLSSDRRHLLEEFRVVHAARKVVGVGSVGSRAWIVLLLGRDDSDPLFLQVKEAQPSVLESFVAPSVHTSPGERVVHGQHLMQSASDIFLGWDDLAGVDSVTRSYYVRQLRDWKGSATIETMSPDSMAVYGRVCGWTLARAHARSGDRVAIASYLGTGDAFDHALADFAEAYADQNERDYDALVQAERTGRIAAQRNV
jgi:uncharacterized protein (DUF2252 family)